MGHKKDFARILENGHFHRLAHNNSPHVFVLDTGVIIDLEDDYHSKKISIHPAAILERACMDHPIIITPGVLQEIKTHRKERKNQYRFEISEATYVLAKKLQEECQIALSNPQIYGLDSEESEFYRYYVHLAANHAFQKDYRKGVKNPISNADKEMMHYSLLLGSGSYQGKPLGLVNILSPDGHIQKTIETLKIIEDFKKHPVKVIHTRKDMRRHLRK